MYVCVFVCVYKCTYVYIYTYIYFLKLRIDIPASDPTTMFYLNAHQHSYCKPVLLLLFDQN